MENLDAHVLRTAHAWLRAGHETMLVTVTRTWGSSPRPVGSLMALRSDGAVVGSVSGGCIEDDLIHTYARAAGGASGRWPGRPMRLRYGVSAAEARRFGLPCGGTMELLAEFNPDASILGTVLARLDRGKLVRRTVFLADGRSAMDESSAPAQLLLTNDLLEATFGPEYRMLLIGGGQLSEYLATMALFNGFTVTVCDPRVEHIGAWAVAGVCVKQAMPDDVVAEFQPDRRSCVIALTHDPKLDDLALLEAVRTPAFYVGAIGSRRNSDARRARLIEHFDMSEDEGARLRGPIGIYIGSKTPAEIAVSVMAEVIAVRNSVSLPRESSVLFGKMERTAAASF